MRWRGSLLPSLTLRVICSGVVWVPDSMLLLSHSTLNSVAVASWTLKVSLSMPCGDVMVMKFWRLPFPLANPAPLTVMTRLSAKTFATFSTREGPFDTAITLSTVLEVVVWRPKVAVALRVYSQAGTGRSVNSTLRDFASLL